MNIQMILALGAMMLLSMVIINFNKTSMSTEDVMYDSNFGITATSIASSVIEDASKKRFDAVFYVGEDEVTNPADFTPPGSLGIDAGEIADSAFTFNDFDDYHGFTDVNNEMPTAIFNIRAQVVYVDTIQPYTPVNYQTWNKQITVWVASKSMRDTVVMSSIFSYWTE
jgi:hypothetical protein